MTNINKGAPAYGRKYGKGYPEGGMGYLDRKFITWDGEGADTPAKPLLMPELWLPKQLPPEQLTYRRNEVEDGLDDVELAKKWQENRDHNKRVDRNRQSQVTITRRDLEIEHRYVLMKNNVGGQIINPLGIRTEAALDFLCDTKLEHPHAIHVIFGGSYDVNMILRDLPYSYLKVLQQNGRVFWSRYNIHYIPRKYFRVSRYPLKRQKKVGVEPEVSVTLWDVIGFFQGSFVKAIREHFPKEEDQIRLCLPEIEAGKARRSQFSLEELDNFVIPYTQKELDALETMMVQLRKDFYDAGIRLQRWDGAGAAAAAVLKKEGVKQYYPKGENVYMYTKLEPIFQRAYGGGRVEMFMYGHHEAKPNEKGELEGYVYKYDEIGSYPAKMKRLPNLANGEWVHLEGSTDNVGYIRDFLEWSPFSVHKVYWDYRYSLDYKGKRHRHNDFNGPFPFFYRQPWNEARIFYPPQGYSWVWWPELEAAMDYSWRIGGELKILESWVYRPGDDIKPFAFVEPLYKRRLEHKAAGETGLALAEKLAVNSFYGKLAQTIGYDERTGKKPPFYNLAYAGYITSCTRANMFRAMMQKPDKIIAVATDGIWSLEPLDLDIGKNLGQWEEEKLKSFTSVQAGVYFSNSQDDGAAEHYRGFNKGTITEQAVIKGWRDKKFFIEVPTKRFVTLGTGLTSVDRYRWKWRTWEEGTRQLALFPGPGQKRSTRDLEADPDAATQLIPCIVPTEPAWFEKNIHTFANLTEEYLSKKHPLPWDKPTAQDYRNERAYQRAIEFEQEQSEADAIGWEIEESYL